MSIHDPFGPLPLGARAAQAAEAPPREKLRAEHIFYRYGHTLALRDVSVTLHEHRVTAFIGPSGCGKSTLLRVFNRMYDLYPDQSVEGRVLMDGADILGPHVDVVALRTRIGMVFQKPTPFPMSIFDNVALGIRLAEDPPANVLAARVEDALRRASLWDEVKDGLGASGLSLSGGQQQRLCIARTIAVKPDVILLDEPCSALDPLSTAHIEATIDNLKADYTIAIVTHNLQQAARISDYTAFMYLGEILEFDRTERIFTNPSNPRTRNYVTGRFG